MCELVKCYLLKVRACENKQYCVIYKSNSKYCSCRFEMHSELVKGSGELMHHMTCAFCCYQYLADEQDDEGDEEFSPEHSPVKKAKPTERCHFWPNCKNGDSCMYHHPSSPCRLDIFLEKPYLSTPWGICLKTLFSHVFSWLCQPALALCTS